MKRTRHSPAQIIRKLRDADGMAAAGRSAGEVCQALGVSDATLHRWRQRYGGMKAEEVKRLKELEEENKRLKKLLAEAELDKAILEEALEGN
jgi:transposase-like protein